MRRATTLLIILCIISCVFALDKPTNYFAGSSTGNGGVRGVQQQAQDFAVWNTSSNNWVQVLPPRVTGGSINGIVAVGDGLLAFGSFSSIGSGNNAAGLAYYDGKVWAAPEGIGLYVLGNLNTSYSFYDNIPSGTGTGTAAVVDGTTVYLYGTFDQVGLVRDGVNGFVALSWSAGGVFTINKIGNGYYKKYTTVPANPPNCVLCPGTNVPTPAAGTYNKMRYYRSSTSNNLVFVFQPTSPGDIWQWEVNTGLWIQITGTATNGAINITAPRDFDVAPNTNSIFVVGNFQRLNDPTATFRYQHVAVSTDNGNNFNAFGSTLNQTLFADLPAVYNSTTGVTIQPALTGVGFYSVAAQSATQIWVAGGVRDGFRQTGQSSGVPNELQTKVFTITANNAPTSFSERFYGLGASGTTADTISGPNINQLQLINGNLYAYGNFQYYRQIANPNIRFTSRYTNGYKGAAVLNIASGQWRPAFGGFLTTSKSGDVSPLFPSLLSSWGTVSGSTLIYFSGNNAILSTWGLLSGSMFAYGGDKVNNAQDRWNVVFGNNRFTTVNNPSPSTGSGTPSAFTWAAQPFGSNGDVNAILIVDKNDAIIFGGRFDFIGSNLVPGVGFYNPDLNLIGSVGGGLFQYNSIAFYQSDNVQNNRVGGIVNDLAEYNGFVYAAGLFNRNNSGNPLANIASISFRTGGAGWVHLDGGCDQVVNDILIRDGKLYATGAFQYCGLNPEGFKEGDGLFRGRVPTSGIAVIDLDLDPSLRSWRPLGIGLQGGAATGNALAYRRGFLYVAGSFTSAGGYLFTTNLAKWDGNAWTDVLGICAGACDRPTNYLTYIGTAVVPNPSTNRRPLGCSALSTLQGNVYCIDSTNSVLAWYDGTYWHQAGVLNVVRGVQNSVIVNNGSNANAILVAGNQDYNANGGNFFSWNPNNQNYEPSFTGFSTPANALASGSIVVVSQLLAICLLVAFMFFF